MTCALPRSAEAGGPPEQLGSSGAGGGDRRAHHLGVPAAHRGRAALPAPPAHLQPPAAAGRGGPVLRPPLPRQGQDTAGPHLRPVHLRLWLRWVKGDIHKFMLMAITIISSFFVLVGQLCLGW